MAIMRDKPRLYIDTELAIGQEINLSKEQSHYIANVMRKNIGDEICVFDGKNGEFDAKITQVSKKSVTIECIKQIRAQDNLPNITLFFAPIKGHRNDNIIEKATEIGIKNIFPIISERTIVRKPNIEKYRLNAIEAVEQCESLTIPNFYPEKNLMDAINAFEGDKIFFADEAGGGNFIKNAVSQNDKSIALLIGPEGGFSEGERKKLLTNKKVCPISLGGRILRADTAVITGLALLQSFWGDWK